MKSKADKHREAGTLDAFRARQRASRASTVAYQQRMRDAPPEPIDEDRLIIEMAMIQTLLDAVQLLTALRDDSQDSQRKAIDDMAQRLLTMASSIKQD